MAGDAPVRLLEVVTPRTNEAGPAAADRFFAALAGALPLSLEIASDDRAQRFFVRAPDGAGLARAAAQLGATYPQAALRPVDAVARPELDPAYLGRAERAATCVLRLASSPALPLRTTDERAAGPGGEADADPLLGLLGALGDVPPGWRSLSQLVLRPAPEGWARGYADLLAGPPAATRERADAAAATQVRALAALGTGAALAYQGALWYSQGDWGRLALLAAGLVAAIAAVVTIRRALGRRTVLDPRLVREKLGAPAYRAELRLSLFAPESEPEAAVRQGLARLAAAYRQFDLPAGNGLRPRPVRPAPGALHRPRPLRRDATILSTRELAALWRLPHGRAELPRVERAAPRVLPPRAAAIEDGCRIGVAVKQGREVPVALPDDLLRRHLLLVAKTRRGKSALMLRLFLHLVAAPDHRGRPACVVLVDPHRDLADAALGAVAQGRRDDVVVLDVAEAARPFGLNLLDVGLGWDRDKAVANALGIFRREFDRFWGPRMEDAFRFALLTLREANERLCAEDPGGGRGRQHTLLDVGPLFGDAAFRRDVLASVGDPIVRAWWSDYFERLDRRLQQEVVNPVLTKVAHFAGSRAASRIVGQPRSTVDPRDWLARGAVVVLSTAKGAVGEGTAALLGGTLINLVSLVVGEQARLDPEERRRCALVVDECQTMPGADYEAILAELGKYGASLVLATQSLGRLEALDRERGRALRSTVFANLDGLFAFHCSAEDARYLARELGDEVDESDLLDLGEHRCYCKLSSGGARLPLCSVALDPPPPSDPAARAQLADASARRWGRPIADVEADLRSARARVEQAKHRGAIEPAGAAFGRADGAPPGRRRGRRRGPLLELLDDEEVADPAAPGE